MSTDTETAVLFRKIDERLNTAYETNDVDRISVLLSEDWSILEPQMGIKSKAQFLNAIAEGRLYHSAMKKEVLEVKQFGDFTIVITRGKNVGHYAGQPFEAEQWVTNIYQKKDSEWLCIMTQEAPVIGE